MIKFALRNEYNQEFALSTSKSAYMPSPSGLGYSMDGDYTRIGNNWISGNLLDVQPKLSGDVYIQSNDAFKDFFNLTKFIRTASKLKFVYQNTQGEYLRDVDVISVEHGGMVGAHTIKCNLTMVARSLWYSNSVTYYSISSVASDAMRYPVKFPSVFLGAINGEIQILNDGSVEAPFTVSFMGPILNPVLTLFREEKELSRMEIVGEATAGESIELSTIDGDLFCYLKTASESRNLTDKLDIGNDNFFKIPIGRTILQISSEGDITKPIIITVRKLYRAV